MYAEHNKALILRKPAVRLMQKCYRFLLALTGLKKAKKHPVFFTHFCIRLTWFSDKIKPFVIFLHTLHFSKYIILK